MDSGTISFQDLNLRRKLIQEELEDLVRIGNESKSRIVLNMVPLNKEEHYFRNARELSEVAKQQQSEKLALLKEQDDCNKTMADINTKIKAMEETLQKLKNEESLGKTEMKQIKKPLLQAIKMYSTKFNLVVDLKKHETDTVVASVKFFNQKHDNTVDFLIDRKTRRILDFNAEWLISKEEKKQFKHTTETSTGWNIELILHKLRDSV